MLNGAVTNTRERFPESDCVVIASCKKIFSLLVVSDEQEEQE